MQRVDDRVNDPYDRRKYNAWCGVWRDESGNHYQRVLLWHPLLWWDLLRPASLFRGMRAHALLSYWKNRRVLLMNEASEDEGEGA